MFSGRSARDDFRRDLLILSRVLRIQVSIYLITDDAASSLNDQVLRNARVSAKGRKYIRLFYVVTLSAGSGILRTTVHLTTIIWKDKR